MFQSSSQCPANAIGWLGAFTAVGAASYMILRYLSHRGNTGISADPVEDAGMQVPPVVVTEDTWVAAAVANELAHSRRRGDPVDLDAEIDDTAPDLAPVESMS